MGKQPPLNRGSPQTREACTMVDEDATNAQAEFEAHDFDGDSAWTAYLNNLDFPAGVDKDALIEKRKRKWYQGNINAALELAGPSAKASKGSVPKKSSSSATGQGSQAETKPEPAEAAQTLRGYVLDQETLYLFMNMWLVYN